MHALLKVLLVQPEVEWYLIVTHGRVRTFGVAHWQNRTLARKEIERDNSARNYNPHRDSGTSVLGGGEQTPQRLSGRDVQVMLFPSPYN